MKVSELTQKLAVFQNQSPQLKVVHLSQMKRYEDEREESVVD